MAKEIEAIATSSHRSLLLPRAIDVLHTVLELRRRAHSIVKAPPTDLHIVLRRLQLRPFINGRQPENREDLLALVRLRLTDEIGHHLEGVLVGSGVHLVAAEQVAKIQHLL